MWLLCRNAAETRWLKQQTFTSHSSGRWKPKIKVPADWVSIESPLPGLQMASFLLCPPERHGERDPVCLPFFFFGH